MVYKEKKQDHEIKVSSYGGFSRKLAKLDEISRNLPKQSKSLQELTNNIEVKKKLEILQKASEDLSSVLNSINDDELEELAKAAVQDPCRWCM